MKHTPSNLVGLTTISSFEDFKSKVLNKNEEFDPEASSFSEEGISSDENPSLNSDTDTILPDTMGEDADKQDRDKAKYEFGCLMLEFKDVLGARWEEMTSFIDAQDLYVPEENPDRYGKEPDPHVTVKYGFKEEEFQVQEVIDYVSSYVGPVQVKLTGIGIFENEDFDVVKFDVESEQLREMNSRASEFPNEDKFPEYKPHMTVAYVKKGEGKKYEKAFEEDEIIDIESSKFKYGMASGQKLSLECGVK